MWREAQKFAPSPAAVAKNAMTNHVTHYHFANSFTIHDASNPMAVRSQIEDIFGELMRQAESDQKGLLSD